MIFTKALSVFAMLVVETIGFDIVIPLGIYPNPTMCEEVRKVYQRSNKDVTRFKFKCIVIRKV